MAYYKTYTKQNITQIIKKCELIVNKKTPNFGKVRVAKFKDDLPNTKYRGMTLGWDWPGFWLVFEDWKEWGDKKQIYKNVIDFNDALMKYIYAYPQKGKLNPSTMFAYLRLNKGAFLFAVDGDQYTIKEKKEITDDELRKLIREEIEKISK